MPKVAIVAALEREISSLTRGSPRIQQSHSGRTFTLYERDDMILIAGGIGVEAARRASEAAITLYHPDLLHSVGFAGALQPEMHVGDIFTPSVVIDSRDGSRTSIDGGKGTLLTATYVASVQQKAKLGQVYGAEAVDMEAAAVAAAARTHGIALRVTKVISDGFGFDMPDLSRFIDAHGRFRNASFAFHAAFRPWMWPCAAELALNSRKAAKALGEYLSDPQHLASKPIGSKTI